MIRVGIVLTGAFTLPVRERIGFIAKIFTKAGFETHLLCTEGPEAPDPEEHRFRSLHIHPVQPDEVMSEFPGFKRTTRLPYHAWVNAASRRLWNVDTIWNSLIQRFVERLEIDILYVYGADLIGTVLAVANRAKRPVILDLAGVALVRTLSSDQSEERVDARQLEAIRSVDRVLVSMDEAKERLSALGVRSEAILVTPSVPEASYLLTFSADSTIIKRFKPTFLLTYVGALNNSICGIQTVLEAMARLKPEIPELFLAAIGPLQDDYLARLTRILVNENLQTQVMFTGPLEEANRISYLMAADLCLCPEQSSPTADLMFPLDAYVYHMLGKPILAGSRIPVRRYVRETGGGLLFDSGDAGMLAEKIRQLYQDQALRKRLGEQGKQAVRDHYGWEQSANRLTSVCRAFTDSFSKTV